jgi:hypothetical protein
MNYKFDELAKALAQPVGRRAALKRFGVGLAAFALGVFGLANNARAGHKGGLHAPCRTDRDCMKGLVCRYEPLKLGSWCV